MLRRVDWPRRGRDGNAGAPEHDRRRPPPPVQGAAAGLPGRRRARGAAGQRAARVLSFAPGSSGQPSQTDLDYAWPFFSYVIVSVRDGVSGDMTSWRLREDRSAFDQEELKS